MTVIADPIPLPRPAWCAQLVGDERELLRVVKVLRDPPVIARRDGAEYLLTDITWSPELTSDEVEARGRRMVGRLNALARIEFDTEPGVLRFGGAIFLTAAGGRDYYDRATVVLTMTGSAVEEHLGPEGTPVPPPRPDLPVRLRRIEDGAAMDDALRLFADATEWHTLYMVYEHLRSAAGDQNAFDALADKRRRSRFTNTAQHYRHADHSLPDDAMTYADAERFLRDVFALLLDA